jgi:hypothetical protein
LTSTGAGFEPPFALRSVSTPREAADPVTSADFFSDPPPEPVNDDRPKPFFFFGSSALAWPAFAGDWLPLPARPAAPVATVVTSASATGVYVTFFLNRSSTVAVEASFWFLMVAASLSCRSFISGCEAKRPFFSWLALLRSCSRMRNAESPNGW